MLVHERMSKNPYTIQADTPVEEALKRMREVHVRRFPVLDKSGKLVGIIAEKDLLYASPSPATSLSIYEMHYLLSKLTVGEVMIKDVITVTEDMPVEDAARIMTDHKIGSLPVVREGQLVGIITETDLFRLFPRTARRAQKGRPADDVGARGERRAGQDHHGYRAAGRQYQSRWVLSWARTPPTCW